MTAAYDPQLSLRIDAAHAAIAAVCELPPTWWRGRHMSITDSDQATLRKKSTYEHNRPVKS